MSSRIYDFTLPQAVGGAVQVYALGSKLTLLSASQDAIDVRIPELGAAFRMQQGQTYTAPAGKAFRDVILANRTSGACVGEVFVGDGSLTDNAIAGVVGTKSNEYQRTLSDTAWGAAMALTPTTNLAALQVFNKSSSLRRAVVTGVMASANQACQLVLCKYSGQLVNVNVSNPPVSKFAQSAGWVASGELESRYEEVPASLGTMLGMVMVPANGTASWSLDQPLILDPGYGVLVFSSQATAKLVATVEGFMLDM